MNRKVVEIAGRRLSLSNLEKDLYPSFGFTKAHILEYYRRIAKFILPHFNLRKSEPYEIYLPVNIWEFRKRFQK